MPDTPRNITLTSEAEGACYSIAGGNYRVVISGQQTGGAYALIEMHVPPGAGPGPHAHPDIHESFYVLDGEVEFRTEAGVHAAGKGSFVDIPKGGAVHGFKNKSDRMARLLCTVIPSGLEEFFREVGRPVEPGIFLPPKPMSAEEQERFKVLGEQYGQRFYPADYLG